MLTIDENDARNDVEGQDAEINDPCGMCGGQLEPLGQLACLLHLRCRNCGMMFNRPVAGCGDGGRMF